MGADVKLVELEGDLWACNEHNQNKVFKQNQQFLKGLATCPQVIHKHKSHEWAPRSTLRSPKCHQNINLPPQPHPFIIKTSFPLGMNTLEGSMCTLKCLPKEGMTV